MPMRHGAVATEVSAGAPAGRRGAGSLNVVADLAALGGALRQVNQAGAVAGSHHLDGIVIEVLADNENHLAIAIAVPVRE